MALFHRKKKKIKQKIREAYGKPKTGDFDMNAIRRYADRNPDTGFQKLSEKTCNDLNFNDLFAYADRTSSLIGQQCLYDRMRRIPNDRSELSKLEQWISRFETDEPLRTETQYHLQKLSGRDAYYLCDLFQQPLSAPPKWLPWAYPLSFTNVLALLLFLIYGLPQLILLMIIVFVVNAVLH